MERLTAPGPEERAAQLRAAERATTAERRRDYLITLLGALGSVAVGLFLMGTAVGTTDIQAGEVLFWTGLVVGNGGWFASMAWAGWRAAERGHP